MVESISVREWMNISWMFLKSNQTSNENGFPKSLSVVTECFVNISRFQNFVNLAFEKIPAFCAVKVFGLIADWTCFGSKGVRVAPNTSLGVNT